MRLVLSEPVMVTDSTWCFNQSQAGHAAQKGTGQLVGKLAGSTAKLVAVNVYSSDFGW